MLKQPPQQGILDTHTLAEENQSKENSTLVEREQIPNTPFTALKHDGKWYILMANKAITHGHSDKQQAIDQLESEKWFTIVAMAAIIADRIVKDKGLLEPKSIHKEMEQD